jgi:hypothetical protein
MNTFKTQPFKHQLDSLNRSKGREYFADLSEMGTGKTWVRVNEMAQLWGEGRLDGVLIFAPKGVHSNWVLSQIPTHMPDWVRYIAREWSADANKREERITDEVFTPTGKESTLRILAVNWDALQYERGLEMISKFCLCFKRLMIIGDESQRIKNPAAIRTKNLMRRVRKYSQGGYRRIMSGSAVLQGPFDLFSQFGFLDENILQTTSYFAFKAEYAEMLRPGNNLLDHIMKKRTKMNGGDRARLNDHLSKLGAILDSNGRGDLIEVHAEAQTAIEDNGLEIAARKLQQLKGMFNPASASPKKAAAIHEIVCAEDLIAQHLLRIQREFSNPHRLPQVVAKGKDGRPKYRNLEKLRKLIEPHSFRVLKAECLDLPKKVYTQTWFKMTEDQRKAYELMKEEARMVLSDGTVTAVAKLATLMKLSQICSGFIIEPITRAVKPIMPPDKNPKLLLLKARLEDIIEDGQQAIVWARFREEIRQIEELCAANGWASCSYHGGTPDDVRPQHVAAFERGDYKVFIGQQRSGGTGITLVAASRVFYYSNTFSLEDRVQSEDRAHRIGQERDVVYEDMLCAGTIDVKITKALRNKQEIAAIIVGDIDKLLDADEII